ncbi:hypothetical protein SprV_0301040800 [Sparganum proliferum]
MQLLNHHLVLKWYIRLRGARLSCVFPCHFRLSTVITLVLPKCKTTFQFLRRNTNVSICSIFHFDQILITRPMSNCTLGAIA